MPAPDFDELSRLIKSDRAGERLRALDAVSTKSGGRVLRTFDDQRVVPLLLSALDDGDLRVRRAAARGLRPWIADDPLLLDRALEMYATHTFDGGYSHAGLLGVATGVIWVPRMQAVGGHAALLPDANADRYFRFEYFLPAQAPAWITDRAGTAHVVLYFVPEWSYSRQRLIAAEDHRRLRANGREQQRYADVVIEFYGRAALACDVRVHAVGGGGGHHRSRELDVARIVRA